MAGKKSKKKRDPEESVLMDPGFIFESTEEKDSEKKKGSKKKKKLKKKKLKNKELKKKDSKKQKGKEKKAEKKDKKEKDSKKKKLKKESEKKKDKSGKKEKKRKKSGEKDRKQKKLKKKDRKRNDAISEEYLPVEEILEPERIPPDHSSNYNVKSAIKKIRSMSNPETVQAFTEGEPRKSILDVISGVLNRLNR